MDMDRAFKSKRWHFTNLVRVGYGDPIPVTILLCRADYRRHQCSGVPNKKLWPVITHHIKGLAPVATCQVRC